MAVNHKLTRAARGAMIGQGDDMPSDGKWRTEGSRLVLKDRWISVRADDCVTPEGAKIAPYYVLEYSDWVQVVAFNANGEILLVRQYRQALGDFSLELPAGSMDASDQGPLEAARRELLEETGCVGQGFEVIGSFSPNPATHANLIHTVLAHGVHQIQEPADDPTERISHRWVSADQAINLVTSGHIVTSIQIASLFLGLMRTGALRTTVGAS